MADVTVRFGGDATELNNTISQARQSLLNFAPGATNQARGSFEALNAALDRNTAAVTANSTGWRANLQALANIAIVARAAKNALEELVDVEIKGDVILARSFGAIARTDLEVASRSLQRIGAVTTAVVTTVKSEFAAATDAVISFAVAHHAALGEVTEASGLMAMASAGGMTAFRNEVDRTASDVRAKMAQMDADYRHLMRGFAERDPSSGREIGDQSSAGTGVAGLFGDESGTSSSGGAEVLGNVLAGQMDRAKASIKTAGDTLKEFIVDLQTIPDTSHDAAAAIQAGITTIPDYALDANKAFIELLTSIATTGDEAKSLGEDIRKAFADGKDGGAQLAATLDKVEDASQRVDLASRLAKSLQPSQATAFFTAIQTGIDRQRAGLQTVDAEYEAQHDKLNMIGRLIADNVGNSVKEHETRQAEIATLGEQSDELQRQLRLWQDIAAQVKEASDFAASIKAVASATPAAKIDDLSKRRDALAGRPQRLPNETGVTDEQLDLAARVAVLEAGGENDRGLEATIDVMRNRLASGRFGGDLDAVLTKPKQFSAYTPDAVGGVDTSSDAYNRAFEMVSRQFGPNPSSDITKGATSYYAPKDANPAWASKLTNVTDIDHQRFGNAGDRPVHSDEVEQQRREGLEATNKELRDQQAIEAGGTAAQRLSADLAEQDLTTAKDAVAEAQKKVDLAKETLATVSKSPEQGGGTAQEKATANQALVQAEESLKQQAASRDRAREALATAEAQEGSRARLDLTLGSLDRQQAAYAKGSAEYLNFEKQKREATDAFNKQEAANATELEKVRYDAAVKGLAEQKAAIQQSAKDKDISAQQETAQLKAVTDKQEAENRTHFDRLRAIAKQYGTDSVAEVRKTAQAASEAEIKLNDERVKSALAANERIRQSYKETFEGVGNSVSSSIMGILQGTTTMRGLFKNVEKELIQSFIQARVRTVADWAAGEATKLQLSTTYQSLQTSVAATGEAARTSIAGVGALAAAAAKTPAMVGSIQASANETYAGVFGFLSPIMGPLAAGPALAAEALVMAKAALPSFADGSWSLPNDMVANVHAGEMIVPAGPAAMMRAAAGAGGGAQAGGGDIHNYHFNISAVDGNSMAGWLNNGGARQIAKAVGAHQKLNPSTR